MGSVAQLRVQYTLRVSLFSRLPDRAVADSSGIESHKNTLVYLRIQCRQRTDLPALPGFQAPTHGNREGQADKEGVGPPTKLSGYDEAAGQALRRTRGYPAIDSTAIFSVFLKVVEDRKQF
jgi:hypothetical protein